MTTYVHLLRLFALAGTTALAVMVIGTDFAEPREGWEFVPVEVQR